MALAMVTAQRTTCLKRQVGAVLLNGKGHVLSTGYNGVARDLPHCNDLTEIEDMGERLPIFLHACPNARAPSGSGLGGCQALHAEWNAILQCPDVYDVDTCYVTTAPCETCAKLLLGTSCRRVVYLESHDQPGEKLWTQAGRVWERLNVSPFLRAHTGSYIGLMPRP
jgi:dCMP deaminase